MVFESTSQLCRCRWQDKYEGRLFEISAEDYANDTAGIAQNRFQKISGPSFRFNRRSITQLKQLLAQQITPVCGEGCPLLYDDFAE